MGTLFQDTFRNNDTSINSGKGVKCRVTVDQSGYSGSAISVDTVTAEPKFGRMGDNLITPVVKNSKFVVKLRVDTANVIQKMKALAGSDSRDNVLTYEEDRGSGWETVFKGYVLPKEVKTEINESRVQFVRLTAKDYLRSLKKSAEDLISGYTGDFTAASTVLADVLAELGLSLPIKAVIGWRPGTMSLSDDPLSVKLPHRAFYAEDDQGNKSYDDLSTVLQSIVGRFNAFITQEDGSWYVKQPEEYVSGSSVTEWAYDASGALTGNASVTSAVAIGSSQKYTSNEVSGIDNNVESIVLYEHGVSKAIDFNGDFEDVAGSNFSGWDLYDNGSSTDLSNANFTDGANPVLDGNKALRITGIRKASGTADATMNDAAGDLYAEATLGNYTKDSITTAITLNAITRGDGTRTQIDSITKQATYWQLRLEDVGSSDVYFFDAGSGTWKLGSTLTSPEKKNELVGVSENEYESFSYTVPTPPVTGTMKLRLYTAVYNTDNSDSGWDFYVLWDGLKWEQLGNEDQPEVTSYRAYVQSASEGETEIIRTKIGDGPFSSSEGAMRDPNDNFTGNWTSSLQGSGTTLSRLAAESLQRLSKQPRQRYMVAYHKPSSRLKYGAVDFDGKRFFPVYIKTSQPTGTQKVVMAQLQDFGTSGVTLESLVGDVTDDDYVFGGTSSGASTSGTTSGTSVAWTDITNKPASFYTQNGDNDAYDDTQSLPGVTLSDINSNITGNTITPGSIELGSEALLKTSSNVFQVRNPADSAYLDMEAGPTTIKGDVVVEGAVLAQGEVSAYTAGGGGGAGSALNLGDIGDVVLTNLSTDDFLQYNGTDWVNVDGSSLGGGEANLWSESGSDVYYNSGNVGIGTSSPESQLTLEDGDGLHIKHASNSPQIKFEDTTDNDDFDILQNRASDYLTIRSNGSQIVSFQKDGRIGIGTDSPSTLLEIEDGQLTLDNDPVINLRGETAQIRFIDDVGSDFEWRLIEDGADFKLQRASSIGGSMQDYITCNNGGYVGIGSSDPTDTLVIEDGLGTTRVNGAGVYCNRAPAYIQNLDHGGDFVFRTHDASGNAHVGFEIQSDGSVLFGDDEKVSFDGSQSFYSTAGFSIEPDNNAWIRFDQADSGSPRYFDIEYGTSNNTVARFSNEGSISFYGTDGTHALDVYAPTGDVISIGDVDQTNGNSLVYLSGGQSTPYVGTRHGNEFAIRVDNSNVAWFKPYGLNMETNKIIFADSQNSGGIHLTGGDSGGYDDEGVVLRTTDNPPSGEPIFRVLSSGGAERLRVEHSGTTSVTNDFAATGEVRAFNSSDERLKENVARIPAANHKLARLSGVTYNWKEDGEEGTGFLAQDFQRVFPELVTEDEDGFLKIQFGGFELDALQTEAIKENHRSTNENENQIRALQARVKRLERKVRRLEN